MAESEMDDNSRYDDLRQVVDILSAVEATQPEVTSSPAWRDLVDGANNRWANYWENLADEPAEKCGTCRFWNPPGHVSSDRRDKPVGQCRRKSPVYTPNAVCEGAYFPRSSETQWCGEYEPSAEQVSRQLRHYRLNREAGELVGFAQAAVKAQNSGFDWGERRHLFLRKDKLLKDVPDLIADVFARARTLADGDRPVLQLLSFVEVAETGTEH